MARNVVRGTPYHHIDAKGGQGQRGGEPAENQGSTVHAQFREDGINTETRARSTPYHSEAGNPPGARREVLRSTSAESSDHGNQNDPRSNGSGVVLDGADSYERGFQPPHEPTTDSPVPRDAPWFDTRTIREEDVAHLGEGTGGSENASSTDLRELGGVMSRGMIGTSKKSDKDEGELTKDDTLPEVPPAAKVREHDGSFVSTNKFK